VSNHSIANAPAHRQPGYIGGSVLNELLNSPIFSKVQLTAVVRSPEKAEKLKEFGIDVVIGSHSDSKLMEKLAEEADVVLAMVRGPIHCFVRDI
jgi:uncharacterized protein YbjT (DUF2867 family)